MITAAAVLGECGIDLVGEPQWIVAVIFDHVAVIFDLGHWVVPDAQWSFLTSRRRPLNSEIGLGTGFEDFAHRFIVPVTAQHKRRKSGSCRRARAFVAEPSEHFVRTRGVALINPQIAAPAFLGHNHPLSKKRISPLSS